MKLLIYEDDQEDLKNLQECIQNFFSTTDIEYDIQTTNESKYILENHSKYDLIFLDIEAFEENGVDIGCEVRKHNRDVTIIFVTWHSKYLVDGYRAQANRYFLKPIQQEDFNVEMKNVISDYLDDYDGFYDETISSKKIYYKQILYIEYVGKKSNIYFVSGESRITKHPLKYWNKKLANNGFAQSYKSVIVNLQQIHKYTKTEITLVNGEVLPMSRGYRKELESKYAECLHRRS